MKADSRKQVQWLKMTTSNGTHGKLVFTSRNCMSCHQLYIPKHWISLVLFRLSLMLYQVMLTRRVRGAILNTREASEQLIERA